MKRELFVFEKWYASAEVSRKKTALVALLFFLLAGGVYVSFIGQELEDHVARAVEFWARHAVRKDPKLHPRLKILALTHGFGKEKVDAEDWMQALAWINASAPKSIFILHPFTKGFPPEVAAKVREAFARSAPVSAAAIVLPDMFEGGHQFPYHKDEFSLQSMLDQSDSDQIEPKDITWAKKASGYLSGPSESVLDRIQHVGHLFYESHGSIWYAPALLRMNERWAIPYLGLVSDEKIAIGKRSLRVGTQPIPIDRDGRIPINLAYPSIYDPAIYAFEQLRASGVKSPVNPGDVVFLIPLVTNRMMNPHQIAHFLARRPTMMPVAVVNSLLTRKWLRPVNGGLPGILLACAVGGLIGAELEGLTLWVALFGGTALLVIAGLLLFVFSDLMVPWLFPAAGFLLTGCLLIFERARLAEGKVRGLRHALQGSIPAAKLDALIRNPDSLQLEADERVLTLMFIDMVAFSKAAEIRRPKEVFDELRNRLRRITEIVHQCGGVVDRTLGDGMLCVFGYEYDGTTGGKDHADWAVECAIKIQKDNLSAFTEAGERAMFFPLRIGINTAGVYIGNLGGQRRIDMTVIGDGVNYAQRLEAACESNRILFGPATQAHLIKFNRGSQPILRRLIPIKHHSDAVEAFELDPFLDDTALLETAMARHRQAFGDEREEQRWPVTAGSGLQVLTDYGAGRLANLSSEGFALRLERYLGRGIAIRVTLESADPGVVADLARLGIRTLIGQVSWGRPVEKSFLHGVLVKNLSDEQRDALLAFFSQKQAAA